MLKTINLTLKLHKYKLKTKKGLYTNCVYSFYYYIFKTEYHLHNKGIVITIIMLYIK